MMMSASLGLSIGSRQIGAWWPADAIYAVDFPGNRYMKNGVAISAGTAISFSRSSVKLAKDNADIYALFEVNEVAVTNLGALIQPSLIYSDVNSEMVGASVPATNPTNWARFVGGGLLNQITELGTINGLSFIKWRVFGTSNAVSGASIRFSGNTTVSAAQGNVWTNAAFLAVSAGSMAGINVIRLNLIERDGGGGFLITQYGGQFSGDLTETIQQLGTTRTMTNALTSYVMPSLEVTYSTDADVDITLLIATPTLSQTGYIPDPFPTESSGAENRAADQLTVHLPAGEQNLTLTYADDASETINSVSGDYLVPDNLNATSLVSVVSVSA